MSARTAIENPPETAAGLGYRMPAEWEPQACVWVVTPHNAETWPDCLDAALAQFEAWVEALRQAVPLSTTAELGIATNDSWIRDFGPIFVVRRGEVTKARRDAGREGGQGRSDTTSASPPPSLGPFVPPSLPASSPPSLAAHDFRFNGWGNKYEQRDLDDAVALRIAQALDVPLWTHDLVLEGGSIDVNGRGTVMTTEQCLLNPNRNPSFTREQIEAQLHAALGTTHCLWLPGGIVGDDTDGHIDDIARFVAPDTVVAAAAAPGHADHEVLTRNLVALRGARDQDGAKLSIIELPAPEPIFHDYPADHFAPGSPAGRYPLPASYANFLISNGQVFVPAFGQRGDEAAARILERAMPRHRIVPLRADKLVVGLGAFHCLSQQQPAAPLASTLASSAST